MAGAKPRRAAAATRRLPVVASRIPKNPTLAEKTEPNRNAIPRDVAIAFRSPAAFSPYHGHFVRTMRTVRKTSRMPTVVNWRRK